MAPLVCCFPSSTQTPACCTLWGRSVWHRREAALGTPILETEYAKLSSMGSGNILGSLKAQSGEDTAPPSFLAP